MVIEPGSALALRVVRGDVLHIEDMEGSQACDLVAFVVTQPWDRLSVALTRALKGSVRVGAGDVLRSNRGTPMLTIVEDTANTNDVLFASCNRWLYEHHFHQPGRFGCFELLLQVLAREGISGEMIPDPLNLFTNSDVVDGGLAFLDPVTRAGDYVELLAESDCLVGLTACPEDISSVNGHRITPIGVKVRHRETRASR